jgi:hypothetical protein
MGLHRDCFTFIIIIIIIINLMDGKVQSITTIFIVSYEVESIAKLLL